MLKRLANSIRQTNWGRSVCKTPADLDIFKKKPTPRMIWGFILIGVSYTIGWPLVGVLGILAAYLDKPMIFIIGGTAVYGLSHLTFIFGAWLAGADHARACLRWAARRLLLRCSGEKKA